jgi:hypothetical protein
MTQQQLATVMESPKRSPTEGMRERYPNIWFYRRLILAHDPAMPLWRRLFTRRRTVFRLTMHNLTAQLPVAVKDGRHLSCRWTPSGEAL